MKNEFDWQSDDSVVVPKTKSIAVYENKHGNVVIRQGGYPEDDEIIVIHRSHAKVVAESILRVLAEAEAEGEEG